MSIGSEEQPHGVQAISRTADGITHVVQYTPVSGVSPLALFRNLRAAGVDGLTDPGGDVRAAGCRYAYLGSARTLCPMAHWSNAGRADPLVYFRDHTGTRWPVQSTSHNWNNASGITVRYTRGSCPTNAHCVDVWSGNYGNSCWQGKSAWSYDGRGNFIDGSVDIWLNDFNGRGYCGGRLINYAKNSAGYQQNACHEQGHALGLDHNSSGSSCLYANIINRTSALFPNGDDYALLGWLYARAY